MTVSMEGIAEAIGAVSPRVEASVSGWSIDSRTLNPGDCFFALRGPTHDGHNYIAKAFESGASVAIVEQQAPVSGLQMLVPDTTLALEQLGRAARERWAGTVIGVTGSAGKTTTKDTIASLVAVQCRTGRTVGNYNNHLGVPLSILRLPDDAKIAVLEMGMNHAGEIRALAKIAKPLIGVVTNAGWAHTENFADGIEGIALAKRELIEELPANGIAILNADDIRVKAFALIHSGRSILFGFSEDAEVRAENVGMTATCARFRCLGVDFESPLVGRHGVSNVLAGIAAARALGIAPERLREAVRTLAVGKMRGERLERNGVIIINDSYNANPEAMRSMLELLRGTPARRRIAVLGEMLELGREAETLHRGIGKFAVEQGIDAVIGIRGAARSIVEEAIAGGMSDSAALFFETPEEAGDFIRPDKGSYVRPGDAVLFKGSRGVEVEKALERAFGGTRNSPMLYWLFYEILYPAVTPFRVFRYVTARAMFASLTSLFLCIALGPFLIQKLREFQIGQHIREDGPKSHAKKAGTPTMGGVLIVISIIVPTLLWADLRHPYVWIAMFALVAFGLIGFVDDYAKVMNKRNLGLTARQKFGLQMVVAAAITVVLALMQSYSAYNTTLNIPFLKQWQPDLLWHSMMGNPFTYALAFLPFYLFFVLVVVGSSNAVNITDGLDGLAIGLMVISAGALTVLAYTSGNREFANYLSLIRNPRTSELTIFCGSMTGASLGFLWWNAHPAEVFMGDVGSLSLGGAMGVVAVLIKQEILLIFVAGMFVIELMSVILQVGSYKLRKKRIFKMAPIHHHFEALGWQESKIIARFWIIGLVLALFALTTLKLR